MYISILNKKQSVFLEDKFMEKCIEFCYTYYWQTTYHEIS